MKLITAYSNRSAVKAGLSFLSLLLLVGLCYKAGLECIKPQVLHDVVMSCGWWAPLIYIGLCTVRPLLFFPALVFNLASGVLFGPWWGTLYMVLGATAGACLCFSLSRAFGRGKAEKLLETHANFSIMLYSPKSSFKSILLMRLMPVFPWDAVSYGMGLTKARFFDYVMATAIGALPGALVYNFLGCSLYELLSPITLFGVGIILIAGFVAFNWVK